MRVNRAAEVGTYFQRELSDNEWFKRPNHPSCKHQAAHGKQQLWGNGLTLRCQKPNIDKCVLPGRGDLTGLTQGSEQGKDIPGCELWGEQVRSQAAQARSLSCGCPAQHLSRLAGHGAWPESLPQHWGPLGHGLFLPTSHKILKNKKPQ